MAQRNVTTSGSHLAKALVTPTGATTDVTLANVAQAALSVASADAAGRVELATSAETATGQDATRAVTPAGLAAQKFIKSTDVTYKALNYNGAVGSGSSQVARGNHGHTAATATTAGYLSAADKAKLDGIEAKATADQTGAEIVAAVNAELGGTLWQQGGGSGGTHTHSAADLPDRGAFYGKALGASLTHKNSTVDVNIAGLPAKAAAAGTDLVPVWDPQAAAHRHVPVAGLPAGRGIVAPAGDDPAISMELPAAVNRRDFLLGFTATGAVTTTKVATAADVDEMAARGMTTIDTIAELRRARPRRERSTVRVRGHSKAGDGGGGTFMWNPTSTETPDGGTVFAAEGGGTGRWIKLYDQLVNIKSFGAKGDDSTDDTAAVQAAVDSGLPLFVPPGKYRLSASITWANKLTMVSPGNAQFTDIRSGNPEEPLFHRAGRYMYADGTYFNEIPGDPAVTLTGSIILRNLRFALKVENPYGHAFEIQGASQCLIERCTFSAAFRGLTFGQSSFDNTVIGCLFQGYYLLTNGWADMVLAQKSWGIYCSGHTFVYGCMSIGYGVGFYATGIGNVLNGKRIEVNLHGMMLGGPEYNVTGTTSSIFSRGSVSGISLEANAVGLLVKNAKASLISGIGAQGSPGGETRPWSESGLVIENLSSNVRVENVDCGGHFTRGAIINLSGNPLWFGSGSNAHTGVSLGAINSPLCAVGADPSPHYHFLKTTLHPTASKNQTITAFSDLMVRGLTGLNIQNPSNQGPVLSKNLGGISNPSNGASSSSVTFSDIISGLTYAINQVTLQADATSLLAQGPCYYAMTIVSRHSETGIEYSQPDVQTYRTVIGGVGANQRVYITFYGAAPSGTTRRLYRGRFVGGFEGYWDMGAGTSTFTDDGKTPFTAKAMPPRNGASPSRIEDDANYQIIATPSWPTTVHVTNKATTGFTLNFGTAAPDGNQTVAWLMFRP